jgi:O-antigen/teichoic acid export membrane protein
VPAIAGLREVDAASVPAAFRRVLRAGAFAVGLIDAAVIVPLAILVPVLYGHEFTQAAPVFVVLALAAGLAIVAGPVTAFVSARLSAGELLRANLIALAVDVVLALALIPLLGVWGAVVANASGALTRLLLLTRWELAVLGIRWSSALRDSSALWLASVIAVVLALAAQYTPGSPWVHAVVAGLVGAGAYLLGLRLLRVGLTHADADAILRSLPGPLRKGASPLLNSVRHTARVEG